MANVTRATIVLSLASGNQRSGGPCPDFLSGAMNRTQKALPLAERAW
jgi:hypothetical protein